jgi:hypothetical protein
LNLIGAIRDLLQRQAAATRSMLRYVIGSRNIARFTS